MAHGKVIVFSAPSGAGKTTILKHLLDRIPELEFSISATTRAPRGQEAHGKDYYFLSAEDFRTKVKEEAFVEWEEVYTSCYYGTLKTEPERIWAKGHTVVFDVDVKGALSIKKLYGENALLIFVMPPSVQILRERLINRSTDAPEVIEQRVAKAELELTFAKEFDKILINDLLESAFEEGEHLVREFIR
jgi:guanylate kinase